MTRHMTLVVFDLDGTLTRTFAADGDCYLQAFDESLGIKDVNDTWSEYEHVTDLGVMQEIFQSRFGRAPDPAEIEAFVDCFVGLLRGRYESAANAFGEIPGAKAFLARLRQPTGALRLQPAAGNGRLASKSTLQNSARTTFPRPSQRMDRHGTISCKPPSPEPRPTTGSMHFPGLSWLETRSGTSSARRNWNCRSSLSLIPIAQHTWVSLAQAMSLSISSIRMIASVVLRRRGSLAQPAKTHV
jgi:hypothetical protein